MHLAIVYHFFAHYRQPVLEEIKAHPDVSSLALLSGYLDPYADVPSADLGPFDHTPTPVKRIGPLIWQRGVVKFAATHDKDVVVYLGNFLFLSTWLALLIGRVRGSRQMLWTHGFNRDDSAVVTLIKRLFFRLGGAIATYDSASATRARELVSDNCRVDFIGNSLRSPSPANLCQPPGSSASSQLLMIGRLTRGRGVEEFVSLISELSGSGVPVAGTVVGDGPLRHDYASSACGLVRFVGPIYDEEQLAFILSGIDLAVFPGEAGLSVIHCLYHRIPVIARDFPGQKPEVRAIEESQNGLLLASDAPLTPAVRQYLTQAKKAWNPLPRHWTAKGNAARLITFAGSLHTPRNSN